MLGSILSLPYLACFSFAALIAWALRNKYGYGIAKIKGPTLAAYTDLWRFWLVWGARPEKTHIALHDKYGPVVRLGPNNVSISDPEAIKIIYAVNASFVKSEFYPVQQTVNREGCLMQGMFNTTDEKYHAKLRRAVSNAYALSTLVQFEPFVDSTTKTLLQQLSERFADRVDDSGICNLGEWLQFYAFDVIGELTYSQRLGFVDRGVDVDNIIGNLEWFLRYSAIIGQIPILDRLLLKNPIRLFLTRIGILNATSPVVAFAKKRMTARLASTKAPSEIGAGAQPKRDFLTRFLEASEKDPEFMHQNRVLALTTANMFAGSDTTAITLRAIFYFLLRNPEKLQKLLQELEQEQNAGHFSDSPLVKWRDVQGLPYLTAVIKEALRCHPAAGLPLERIVPPKGIEVCGHILPGSTIVGCSAWTVHRSETVFGPETNKFRPERWIEATEKQKAKMTSCLFSFGAGARTCVGKNISYLEIYKLVPALLRTYEISLVNPEKEWELRNAWFIKQSNFLVRLKTKPPKPQK